MHFIIIGLWAVALAAGEVAFVRQIRRNPQNWQMIMKALKGDETPQNGHRGQAEAASERDQIVTEPRRDGDHRFDHENGPQNGLNQD